MKRLILVSSFFCAISVHAQHAGRDSVVAHVEGISYVYYYLNEQNEAQREPQNSCTELTIITKKPVDDYQHFHFEGACNLVQYVNEKAFPLTNTSAPQQDSAYSQTELFFAPIRPKQKFQVQVGNEIYIIYKEVFCNCYDPMCGAKHGHLQFCNEYYFTKEFGTLISSSYSGHPGHKSLQITEVEDQNAILNALVYYLLTSQIFLFQPDHPILLKYLNR